MITIIILFLTTILFLWILTLHLKVKKLTDSLLSIRKYNNTVGDVIKDSHILILDPDKEGLQYKVNDKLVNLLK
ncbi:MAG: hypothetical protein AAB394_02790 [Patescibacteria group bacterium]